MAYYGIKNMTANCSTDYMEDRHMKRKIKLIPYITIVLLHVFILFAGCGKNIAGGKEMNYSIEGTESEITDYKFISSNLSEKKLKNKTFNKCRFVNCKWESVTFENFVFNDCVFSGIQIIDCYFFDSIFDNCQIDDSRFSETSLYKANIKSMAFKNTTINDSSISSNNSGDKVKFSNCRIKKSAISYMELDRLDFTNVSFDSVDIEGKFKSVVIEKSDIKNLKVIESICERFALKKCSFAFAFRFFDCEMKELDITNSTLYYFKMDKTKLTEKGNFDKCKFDGFGIFSSNIVGLSIKNCQITDYISIKNNQFDGLRLENIKYDPKLEIVPPVDVTYKDSDKFIE